MSKPRSLTRFNKLTDATKQRIKLKYPYGFDRHLISFKDAKGKFVFALPFETENIYYLIKMTRAEAIKIFSDEIANEEFEEVVDLTEEEVEVEEIPEEMINETQEDLS